MSNQELPLDRLATTDEKGRRVYLHPADVQGKYRKRRTWLSAGLVVFFLVLPWIQINGQQALWIDIARRRFSIFGLLFWAHDAPILAFVLGGAAISLAFVTAVWGRVWCGWACPQTVFIDAVFRRIERWVEGDHLARKKLDARPWDAGKLIKRAAKWTGFLGVSLVITHSFLAYFIGTGPLLGMIRSAPQANPGSFLLMAGATVLVLFDFGWFREQFCTIVCPYGRFQSVLMDDRSVVVAYDARRGEPRKGTADQSPAGDCVNCYRCVKVCPTGVDIRRGVQLECIACSSCIDACDDVMERLKKPKGLIRYDSLAHIQGPVAARSPDGQTGNQVEGQTGRSLPVRPLVYGFLLVAIVTGLFVTVSHRTAVSATLIRAIDTPYQQLSSPSGEVEILNHFKLHLGNQSFEDQAVRIELAPDQNTAGVSLVLSNHQEVLPAGAGERADLFVKFPKSFLRYGHARLKIEILAKDTRLGKEITLVGPSQ